MTEESLWPDATPPKHAPEIKFDIHQVPLHQNFHAHVRESFSSSRMIICLSMFPYQISDHFVLQYRTKLSEQPSSSKILV